MKWRERLSKREASSAVTLIFTVLIIQIVIFLFNLPDKKIKTEHYNVDARENPSQEGQEDESSSHFDDEHSIFGSSDKERNVELFEFDPNSVSIADLVRLGLSEKQAASIINYRSKGGVFRKREDLKKIYVVPEEFYDKVEDYIVITGAESRNSRNVSENSSTAMTSEKIFVPETSQDNVSTGALSDEMPVDAVPKRSYSVIEINRADSLDLLDLPGIGPYYASRIIRYRNRIGGFISKEQLKEVAGIDEERYALLEARVVADTLLIHKTDLNLITVEELSSNPYIGSYLARAIVRLREQSGDINIKLLLENRVIDKFKYELLKYYFF